MSSLFNASLFDSKTPVLLRIGLALLFTAGALHLYTYFTKTKKHNAMSSSIGMPTGEAGLTRKYAATGSSGTLCNTCQFVGGNG